MATGEVPKIAEVIKLASAAVQADSVGDLERAVSLYQQAADALAAMVASGTGSESDTKEWEGKAAQYKARVTYLQQRVQQEKIQQYANTAKLAQDGMQLAATIREEKRNPASLASKNRQRFLLIRLGLPRDGVERWSTTRWYEGTERALR